MSESVNLSFVTRPCTKATSAEANAVYYTVNNEEAGHNAQNSRALRLGDCLVSIVGNFQVRYLR